MMDKKGVKCKLHYCTDVLQFHKIVFLSLKTLLGIYCILKSIEDGSHPAHLGWRALKKCFILIASFLMRCCRL